LTGTVKRRGFLPLLAVAALLSSCGGSTPEGPSAMVFVSVKDGDYAIFGAHADGKHARRLTKEKGDPSTPAGLFFQLQPAWSPDGEEIAFSSARDRIAHIYVMNADGTGTRRLTDTDQGDEHPSWSADGKRIVFSREGALFAAPAAGGSAHRVGRGLGSAQDPAYSPDGKLIAYDYRKPGFQNREIFVMNADGTAIRPVTRLGGSSGLPAWSPDGKTLAFQSNASLDHYEIFTVAVNGTRVHRVTSSGIDAIQPAFTPDGSIGFSRDGAIWVDDGKAETQLTSGKDDDTNPVWRPVQPQ
jgi:Tol biopolymer transport system component